MLNLCCQFLNSFFTLNRSTLQLICWVYYFYKYIFCTWYLQLCFYSVFLTPAQIFKFFSYPLMVFCILILSIFPAQIHSFCIVCCRWFCTWSFFYKACVLGGCSLQRLPANEAPAFSFCLPAFGSCVCARMRKAPHILSVMIWRDFLNILCLLNLFLSSSDSVGLVWDPRFRFFKVALVKSTCSHIWEPQSPKHCGEKW